MRFLKKNTGYVRWFMNCAMSNNNMKPHYSAVSKLTMNIFTIYLQWLTSCFTVRLRYNENHGKDLDM